MVQKQTYELVKFRDDFLEVVRVAATGATGKVDGEYFVSVRKVCENLDINFTGQLQKLKSDESYGLTLIEVKTKGGIQRLWCIPLEKLNGWLFTINPNKVKPEVKEKLIAYKNECFKVLYNHFIAKAQTVCKADQMMTPRIMAYKSNLAQRKKQILQLKSELATCQEEKEQLKQEDVKIRQFIENNLFDLAAELARHNQLLKSAATTLEIIAKDLHQSSDHANFFLDNILKHYPKAKENVERVRKHFRRFYG